MPTPSPPRLTVVLLTWNEAPNIAACLDSLAAQEERDFEVVVVDAASTDRTAELVRAAMPGFPVPLRLEVAERRISVGEARNRGVRLARAPAVAFLSADAEAGHGWVAEALRSLEAADLVFGRQVHAPRSGGPGAAVRALRYHHFPAAPVADAASYASHVSAAIRRGVLEEFPFGTDAASSAVDDVLLARRAERAGHRAGYNPRMVALHRDVESAGAELRKNLREGLGWGAHAGELGLHRAVLAWGALLAAALAGAALAPGWPAALALLGALWLPAVRRALRARGRVAPGRILVGLAASPPFDLAFLLAYVRGLVARRVRRALGRAEGAS